MNSAEFVVKVANLARKLEEASAQGFRNKAAMELLYSLEGSVEALLSVATAEFLAHEGKS